MHRRELGTQGLVVSAMGLGCMGMSEFYGKRDEAESRAIKGKREKVVIATKFSIVRKADDPNYWALDSRPERVRASCEGSLKRLGVDCIDLYYQHRVDTPRCRSRRQWAQWRSSSGKGKSGIWDFPKRGPRPSGARAVHPITALQSEYSLWSREPENDGVLLTVRKLEIGFVADCAQA